MDALHDYKGSPTKRTHNIWDKQSITALRARQFAPGGMRRASLAMAERVVSYELQISHSHAFCLEGGWAAMAEHVLLIQHLIRLVLAGEVIVLL
jgi:hypothetical protein